MRTYPLIIDERGKQNLIDCLLYMSIIYEIHYIYYIINNNSSKNLRKHSLKVKWDNHNISVTLVNKGCLHKFQRINFIRLHSKFIMK